MERFSFPLVSSDTYPFALKTLAMMPAQGVLYRTLPRRDKA